MQAEKWLGKVTRIRKNPNPDSRFYLARAMKQNGKYNESVEEFQQFITETTNDSLKKIASLELEGSKLGLKLPDNELIVISNAGNSVNTQFADFGATMANMNEMFYSSFQRDDYITIDGKEGNYHSRILSASKTGENWSKGEEIKFNFASFTFPSCTKCNTDFAKIEALVKPIIENILNDEFITSNELVLLLDWFDKVRISLWLGIQYHNKGTFNLEPKYYSNTRLRLKDRMLAITNCYDGYKGLRWTGANTLCFISSPTCITLKINNVIFTNCSMDFILSEQLGFPYPAFERQNPNDDKLMDIMLLEGTKKYSTKIFNTKLYDPTIIVSQPIFKVGIELQSEKYATDFVKANSYDFNAGEGKLFITHDNMTYPMEIDEEISFGSSNKIAKIYKFNRPTLELQIELLSSRKLVFDSDQDKENHFSALKTIVDYTKEQIRQYDY